jgi:hypothetical protein
MRQGFRRRRETVMRGNGSADAIIMKNVMNVFLLHKTHAKKKKRLGKTIRLHLHILQYPYAFNITIQQAVVFASNREFHIPLVKHFNTQSLPKGHRPFLNNLLEDYRAEATSLEYK